MTLPRTLHEHHRMQALLEQVRTELADGALRGATRCGFADTRERNTAAMMALIYAAKEIAVRAGMLELYHVFLAGEIPAYRAGREEVQ